ncbi:hypothetical protein LMH87_005041 [Akanthomyces muscarius]|uniref:WLM domain-containing protein n=1 Tax=Akanthomyces muscarius TaxID=2231603 RepID=A0A9W8QMZ6_AKAMU|nr:hypothetical protein LMH87_005041 [Akanthomyces muscarius]KAJ4163302.1 hypothetical protein LMH87_005041 [Akanthomyces muscarius]
MPVGIQRLNARRTQPNPNIVFIKPLPGPDSAIAEKFLERIAAQCLPIMKEHHLSVVTLEEYEPNREFVGRNFNAGEVIQLVLKSARPPHRWLPFRYVQMVMMHELAHCVQMNHSRAFWAVRNAYAAAMTGLWSKGYTGEGIWGRGAALGTGAWEHNTVTEGELLPEHLCGGTYRSRRRGRKRKPKLSWKEQKERRIAKKFGTNGTALGADEVAKVKLEGGKKVSSKPRVAGSARGRELRAAAALARFDTQKVEEVPIKDDETASESDYEEEEDGVAAVDVDGKMMKDKDGQSMVKVCEDEDGNDPAALNERDELRSVFARPRAVVKSEGTPRVKGEPESSSGGGDAGPSEISPEKRPLRLHDIPHIRDAVPPPPSKTTASKATKPASSRLTAAASTATGRPAITIRRLPATTPKQAPPPPQVARPVKDEEAPPTGGGGASGPAGETPGTCPLCSLDNDATALRCAACANVLRPDAVQGSWTCGSASCEGTGKVVYNE